MPKEARKKRYIVGLAIVSVIFCALLCVLIKIQLVDAAKYKAASASLSVSQTKVKAARGEILDCNGNPLVTNRQGNSIIFKYAFFPSYKDQAARTKLVASLLHLFEENKAEWIDNLPLVYDKKGELTINKDKKAEFKYLVSDNMLNLPNGEKATAKECMAALIKRYGLESYSEQEARKIASVFFGMKYLSFSSSAPYTFAEDVSTTLVSKVKENSSIYPGVDTEAVSYREYADKANFSNLLGVVGSISAEEYSSEQDKLKEKLSSGKLTNAEMTLLKNNAYALNDTYGKSGFESALEPYLRGQNGIKTTTVGSDGTVKEDYAVKPVQGNTVVTTIDAGLQKVAAKALQEMLTANKNSSYFGVEGALVVENVKTGAILACVSLPSYNITKYFSDYSKLSSDPESPLWNRSLQSAYAPGSTMKPAMAIAGLEEKVIDENTTVHCTGTYHYLDMYFSCMGSHGYVNVRTALEKSCNTYFFEVGRRLGIDRMNKYSSLLGLGQKTGVELPEVAGTLASIAEREASGGTWKPGDTVQAAIGQSDNLFTPLQLVNYCATIANGGTRYKPYLVKSVMSYDMSKTISETKPTVLNKLGASAKNVKIVKEGMREVILNGGPSSYFRNCIVDVAGKTGTSQLWRTTPGGKSIECNNGFFISFAPYDNPEIAVVVVAENSKSGSGISKAGVDVYNYYFGQKKQYEEAGNTNELIP